MSLASAMETERAHFIDEAGTHISMTRTYARAPRGARTVDHVPRTRGTVTTVIGSLCHAGIEAVWTFVGGTTGDRFLEFVTHHLGPKLKPGDVVVWDNLAAHRDARVCEAIKAAGASITRLPPYSPDLNPIEYMWSPIKHHLRTAKVRDAAALPAAIDAACATVTPAMATATIRHCGYGAQP